MKNKRVDNLRLQNYLSEERSTLSEERTILSYIRTVLTFFVSIILLLKLFFEKHVFTLWILIILTVSCGLVTAYFLLKLNKIKAEERRLKRKLPKFGA